MNKMNSQQGFALLEALIAMFITAGVLLGLGVLHIKSVQQSALTTQRTIASIQANDLIDRMWASVCSLDNSTGQPDTTKVNAIKTQWQNRWKVEDNESDFVEELTSDQIALHNRMNGWSGNLEIVNAAKRRYKITIEWENKKAKWYEANPADKESFIYHFAVPKCEV
ncbi:type IV pilus modification PilV family protein [Acinetobacter indicus]|uniref:type IV pilus modification PilV family protein n=1 Tax=Acinetobacter indicus TaxID=756892 RepID=UPI001443B8D7|nr:prepilin-type N-terminal cleavage/methylation domain-containing protein [Acinetobacter indicus]